LAGLGNREREQGLRQRDELHVEHVCVVAHGVEGVAGGRAVEVDAGDGGFGAGTDAAPESVSQANSRCLISAPCVASNTAASKETLLLL
jgi:hypothetical protein